MNLHISKIHRLYMCFFLQIEPKYTFPLSVKRKKKEKLYNNTVAMILVRSLLSNTLKGKDLESSIISAGKPQVGINRRRVG